MYKGRATLQFMMTRRSRLKLIAKCPYSLSFGRGSLSHDVLTGYPPIETGAVKFRVSEGSADRPRRLLKPPPGNAFRYIPTNVVIAGQIEPILSDDTRYTSCC